MGWYTTKDGHHVNTEWFDNDNAIKEKQIAANEKEAADRNGTLPRRLYLSNIKAEDANKTSDILDLRTHERYRFKEGTEIKEVHAFAGKGCLKEFRQADKYANRYGGNAKDYQHCSGKAQITNGSKVVEREVHWVQGIDGKMHEAFIKYKK